MTTSDYDAQAHLLLKNERRCPDTICEYCIYTLIKGSPNECSPETAREVAQEYLESKIENKSW